MSRSKGQRGEREVCEILQAHGYPAQRTPLSGGGHWKGDIQALGGHGSPIPKTHIEVKRAERLQIPAWIKQAEDDCPEGSIPLLVYRSSREPWRAVVPFEWLVSLLSSCPEYMLRETSIEGEVNE